MSTDRLSDEAASAPAEGPAEPAGRQGDGPLGAPSPGAEAAGAVPAAAEDEDAPPGAGSADSGGNGAASLDTPVPGPRAADSADGDSAAQPPSSGKRSAVAEALAAAVRAVESGERSAASYFTAPSRPAPAPRKVTAAPAGPAPQRAGASTASPAVTLPSAAATRRPLSDAALSEGLGSVREVLAAGGAPEQLAAQAVDTLGERAAAVLRDDPWQLLAVPGTRPEQADGFARALLGPGCGPGDERRAQALTVWLLERAALEGHTVLEAPTLREALARHAVPDPDEALQSAIAEGAVLVFQEALEVRGAREPAADEEAETPVRVLLGLDRYAMAEESLADGLARLINTFEPETADTAGSSGEPEDDRSSGETVTDAGNSTSGAVGGPNADATSGAESAPDTTGSRSDAEGDHPGDGTADTNEPKAGTANDASASGPATGDTTGAEPAAPGTTSDRPGTDDGGAEGGRGSGDPAADTGNGTNRPENGPAADSTPDAGTATDTATGQPGPGDDTSTDGPATDDAVRTEPAAPGTTSSRPGTDDGGSDGSGSASGPATGDTTGTEPATPGTDGSQAEGGRGSGGASARAWESAAEAERSASARELIRAVAAAGLVTHSGGEAARAEPVALVAAARSLGLRALAAVHTEDGMRRSAALGETGVVTVAGLLSGLEGPGRDADGALALDVLAVLDAPQLDVETAAMLVESLADGTRLVLSGDPGVLWSAGPGRVFADVVGAHACPAVVSRTPDPGPIGELVSGIGVGELGQVDAPGKEVVIVPVRDPGEAVHRTVQLVADSVPRAIGVPADRTQVITPGHGGPAGTRALNAALKERLNPGPGRFGGFDPGDRVAYVPAPGRVLPGTVVSADVEGLHLDCAGSPVVVPRELVGRAVRHGWAVTAHQAAGMRWPAAVVVLPGDAARTLTRAWIYTAFGRGERHLSVVHGVDQALPRAVAEVPVKERTSRLKSLLRAQALPTG
ncbi:helix-hairpin-helix domain-containing protein [Streptomyces sp. NPDC002537]